MTSPAPNEGDRQSANLNSGVPCSRKSRSEDSPTISMLPSTAPSRAALNQIASQYLCNSGAKHSAAASSAIGPKARPAEPGTPPTPPPPTGDRRGPGVAGAGESSRPVLAVPGSAGLVLGTIAL